MVQVIKDLELGLAEAMRFVEELGERENGLLQQAIIRDGPTRRSWGLVTAGAGHERTVEVRRGRGG